MPSQKTTLHASPVRYKKHFLWNGLYIIAVTTISDSHIQLYHLLFKHYNRVWQVCQHVLTRRRFNSLITRIISYESESYGPLTVTVGFSRMYLNNGYRLSMGTRNILQQVFLKQYNMINQVAILLPQLHLLNEIQTFYNLKIGTCTRSVKKYLAWKYQRFK